MSANRMHIKTTRHPVANVPPKPGVRAHVPRPVPSATEPGALDGGICAVPGCGLEVYRVAPHASWHHRTLRDMEARAAARGGRNASGQTFSEWADATFGPLPEHLAFLKRADSPEA